MYVLGNLETTVYYLKNLEGIYTSSGVAFKEYWDSNMYRAAAPMSQNHVTKYFRTAKQHGVQWHTTSDLAERGGDSIQDNSLLPVG